LGQCAVSHLQSEGFCVGLNGGCRVVADPGGCFMIMFKEWWAYVFTR